MNAAIRQPSSVSPRVRPADRLGFTLFLAAVLHVALILGLGFSIAEPQQISKTLEITLSTFKSKEKPKEADFLAQDNQQGSGTLEHKASPKTNVQAPFQDTEVRKVSPPPSRPQATRQEAPKAAIATRSPQPDKTPTKQQRQPQPKPQAAPAFDSSQLSAEIASLEAELAQDVERYAKRPRVNRQNSAATMRDISAWYRDEWRKKVERIGNLNYPDEARRQRIYGSLRMLVTINRDGTVQELRVLESSGQPVLDEAALRIVRLAAPFAPFTGELGQKFDQVEIIRTWRFERGDRLSSR
ncbi:MULTISPECIES: energy transducer TonB [Pseudomonadaceae]|uniref:Protein TonB n=1 Tax=Stutzerimonas degradans TaxID=2968968 RepID=A0A8E2U0U9_9GAMM|nr:MULTISPECIES: energy transducer TonB [Pseudomonadaceae]KGK81229.1 energy transducer TonB [Stutzerimonas degradans]MCQ4268996.1 energy transducer TonB [Stutzerimonas degradans]MCQ4276376.1 energy transducer TonB [Stutzerimonas degradans]OOE11120.1 energy transducer TonB [Stutzerimonas degradans]PNF75820.1 energy transducer TonB [Stutzerimonas degradans]